MIKIDEPKLDELITEMMLLGVVIPKDKYLYDDGGADEDDDF